MILDADLAKLYGVTTKRLNQQVNRNRNRFPEDFVLQLTSEEKAEVVANCDHLSKLKFSPVFPYAFTEHGAIMAASVLNTPRAVETSVLVVRAFVRLREMVATHQELARKLAELEQHFDDHDEKIEVIFEAIRRVTHGADVVIETDLDKLLQLIGKLGHGFYADPDSAKEAFTGSRMLNIIHLETGFKIDLILRKPWAFSIEEFKRRCRINFLGKDRWFATPEDTILTKLEWSKMGQSERQYYEDAVNIAMIQGDSLDRDYLEKWASELGLENLLSRLFSDAGLKT